LILGGKISWDGYKSVNLNQYVCLEKIISMTEEEIEYLEETFTTFLADGKEYDLEINGRDKKLTIQNRGEYIEKCKQIHLQQLEKPFWYIRNGFKDYIAHYRYMHLTPIALEQRLCGMDYVI
jgi:HECT-domain (ubiquitin-transferase)